MHRGPRPTRSSKTCRATPRLGAGADHARWHVPAQAVAAATVPLQRRPGLRADDVRWRRPPARRRARGWRARRVPRRPVACRCTPEDRVADDVVHGCRSSCQGRDEHLRPLAEAADDGPATGSRLGLVHRHGGRPDVRARGAACHEDPCALSTRQGARSPSVSNPIDPRGGPRYGRARTWRRRFATAPTSKICGPSSRIGRRVSTPRRPSSRTPSAASSARRGSPSQRCITVSNLDMNSGLDRPPSPIARRATSMRGPVSARAHAAAPDQTASTVARRTTPAGSRCPGHRRLCGARL
jgi:hypothetical protein